MEDDLPRISGSTRKPALTIRSSDSSGSPTPPIKKKRVTSRQKYGRDNWKYEIIKMQTRTDLLIRKLPFVRLVKEITEAITKKEMRWTIEAINALQEACEAYLVTLIHDGYLCTFHAKRVTLMKRDVQLVRRIRND